MKELEERVRKFEQIYGMMVILKNSEDNEEKKRIVKAVRDNGYITTDEALDLYINYES